MSISAALSSALSGLTASSRQAQLVSNNLANALTPGYAPRRLELTAPGDGRGTGVLIGGVTRNVDQNLVNERRLADSTLAYQTEKSGFYADIERVLGGPDDSFSLTSRLAAFEADLTTAAAKPEEGSRLQAAVLSAADIAEGINDLSRHIQNLRTEAEARIQQDVTDANTLLGQLQTLNSQIVDARNAGNPTASFEDQRHLLLDDLADIIPIKVLQRDRGEIAIYTPRGASLLDGSPAELGFTPNNVITPDLTLENGLLSGLTINGRDILPSGETSPIDGGRLAANFELRDTLAVDAQAQLDAIARNLIERFQDPGVDATRAPGSAGIFTDNGAAFDPADETGLAGRLQLNDQLRPDTSGAYWRLRDGLGAATHGPSGNASLIQSLSNVLSDRNSLASGDLGTTQRDLSDHFGALTSHLGQQRLALDKSVSFAQANQTGLQEIELSQGVNSDDELQQLLLIEQSYSANARMIQVVEDMLDTLLRI